MKRVSHIAKATAQTLLALVLFTLIVLGFRAIGNDPLTIKSLLALVSLLVVSWLTSRYVSKARESFRAGFGNRASHG